MKHRGTKEYSTNSEDVLVVAVNVICSVFDIVGEELEVCREEEEEDDADPGSDGEGEVDGGGAADGWVLIEIWIRFSGCR